MEPAQTGSWRCETFATANEISPPISPVPSSSPASPTLYTTSYKPGDENLLDDILIGNDTDVFSDIILEGGNNDLNPFLTSEGQGILIAAPNAVGGFHQEYVPPTPRYSSSPVDRNLNISPTSSVDFNCEEPSLNLELFEFGVLGTATPSPLNDDVCLQAPVVDSGNHSLGNSVSQSPPTTVSANQFLSDVKRRGGAEFESKFREIVQSLNLDQQQVQEITSEVFDVSELREWISGENMLNEDDTSSSSGSSSIYSSRVHSQEIIVYTDDSQSQSMVLEDSFNLNDKGSIVLTISQPSSVSGSDLEDETQEMIVDTLLQGDFTKAQVFATGLGQPTGRLLSSVMPGTSTASSSSLDRILTIKPERRGRKPSSANLEGKTWVNLTDKVQRKKEQNKTAATRYRQKKKFEQLQCMQQMQLLTEKHEVLMKERQELTKEISFMKKLLRDCLAKPKQNGGRR